MPPEAKLKFQQHRASAKQRGIEFDLTFEEWWVIWEPHFGNRGRSTEQFQMCRTRDEGAYRAGNVRIDTARSNMAEREATMTRRKVMSALPGEESVASAQSWVHRRGHWGMDYFQAREYREEHPDDYADDMNA